MDEEKVICWLDIKQCEQTKITKETKNYLVYLQGNKFTSEEYLEKFLRTVIDFQLRFCKSKLITIINS